jgi:hypothetical protein
MSTKGKLIERFRTRPRDFTFGELTKLLTDLGFTISNKGKTSGSRVRFVNTVQKSIIDVHKPHTQGSPVKESALKDIYEKLVLAKLIEVETKGKNMED